MLPALLKLMKPKGRAERSRSRGWRPAMRSCSAQGAILISPGAVAAIGLSLLPFP